MTPTLQELAIALDERGLRGVPRSRLCLRPPPSWDATRKNRRFPLLSKRDRPVVRLAENSVWRHSSKLSGWSLRFGLSRPVQVCESQGKLLDSRHEGRSSHGIVKPVGSIRGK